MKITGRRFNWLLRCFTGVVVMGTATAALAAPYVPPSGLGAPGRRESAGTRGCGFGNPANLIALMPQAHIGLTATAYPRFYWYMPINQGQFVDFTLTQFSEGEAIAPVYSTRFAVTGESGIVSLQIPDTAHIPPLEVGDRYRWQVELYCNANGTSGDLQIDGWVEYQPPQAELMTALDTASAAEKADLYARNGYWFDAVDQLATLRAEDPEAANLQVGWQALLESVALEKLVGQPLVQP